MHNKSIRYKGQATSSLLTFERAAAEAIWLRKSETIKPANTEDRVARLPWLEKKKKIVFWVSGGWRKQLYRNSRAFRTPIEGSDIIMKMYTNYENVFWQARIHAVRNGI